MQDGQYKNTISGNLKNIGAINTGDTYHYHGFDRPTPKELTIKLPKTHPDDIIGREDDLDELHDLLSKQKRVVVVNGLGGIGKTTLAQAYVSKYYDEYSHIAWITQDSDNITNDIANTAGLIANLEIDKNGFEPKLLFEEIIRKLKCITNKPNLLVIDNAEQSLNQFIDELPTQPDWHLLVTSREEIDNLHTKQLDFLNEQKAIELFKKHYTHQSLTDEQIIGLIQMVDRHTLTIEILAKTAEVLRYDIGTLQEAMDADLEANLNVNHNKKQGKTTKIASYLGTVFNISWLNEAETWLMKQFACLPPDFHTYALLKDLIIDKEGVYKDVFAKTLTALAAKGWLLQKKGVADSYKMHRIIADVVKIKDPIKIEDVAFLIENITSCLNLDSTKDNPVDKFIWIPFGKALLDCLKNETTIEISVLQNNLALRFEDIGDYNEAKILLEKTLAISEKNFGELHPETATRHSNLALVLQDLGDYPEAKEHLEKALASDKKNFGELHPNTAISYSNLATVLQDLGDYRGAKELLEKAVASNEKNFGELHPNTATSYSNLGLVLKDLGDYQEAKELLEKALSSDEKTFGNLHPAIAYECLNLATVYYELGDYPYALELSDKSVTIFKKNLPEGHPIIETAIWWNEEIKNKLNENK